MEDRLNEEHCFLWMDAESEVKGELMLLFYSGWKVMANESIKLVAAKVSQLKASANEQETDGAMPTYQNT